VAERRGRPQIGLPERRAIAPGPRRDRVEHAGADPDIGEPDRAALAAAGLQQVTGLEAEEGHRLGRPDGDAPHLPGLAINPGRDVDRDNGPSGCVDAGDERRRVTIDIA
jgi:hypothetical protein